MSIIKFLTQLVFFVVTQTEQLFVERESSRLKINQSRSLTGHTKVSNGMHFLQPSSLTLVIPRQHRAILQ